MTPDPLVGQILGQYDLQEHLGYGGMAVVYRALQPALGRQVAVKVLHQGPADPSLPERFRREARIAANLMHPNIVPVYDFGEWQGHLYIVMALVGGGTLKERIHGPLPLEATVRLIGQVADALGYAHGQGVFHRDVKPSNVLLGPGDWAMLGDFGIARALGETTRLTSPHGTIGTPAYMAPEQWLGGEIDGRADLYSLGIMLYELLTGMPPFTATTAQGLMRQHLEMPVPSLTVRRPDVPPALEDVIGAALAKSPGERFRHAGEFKSALESALTQPHVGGGFGVTSVSAGFGTTTRVPRLPSDTAGFTGPQPFHQPPTPRPSGVSKGIVAAILVLVLLLGGAVGFIASTMRGGSSAPAAPPPVSEAARVDPTIQPTGPQAAPVVQQAAPTATVVSPTQTPVIVVITATPLPPTAAPPTPIPPTAAPAPPTRLPASQPVAAPQNPSASDPRFAVVERHVSDYFAALNAGDYARAQVACCTVGWRARYPLAEWQKNFAGVRDLRFTTPFRYPAVSRERIVAEVDYSFVNSSGARREFTLRWTFVPAGSDWLADDASAFPR